MQTQLINVLTFAVLILCNSKASFANIPPLTNQSQLKSQISVLNTELKSTKTKINSLEKSGAQLALEIKNTQAEIERLYKELNQSEASLGEATTE